jgi:hypothetical protein
MTARDNRPDVEIGASFSAKKLRFKEKPKTDVEVHGEPDVDSVIESERENLPEEVEPGVTYRDVHVRWGAAGRLRDPSGRDDAAD